VVLLFILVWSLLAWAAARLLIVRFPLPQADAIVVLSGSATFRERSERAAELYAEGRSQRIILTNDNVKGGWSSSEQRNLFFYESSITELRRRGVPQQSIELVAPPVSTTHDEAVLMRHYSEKHQLRSLLLVTSAYHSRRAWHIFREIFRGSRTQIGLEVAAVGIQTPLPARWWFHLRGWEMVPGEYLKMTYYWLRFE
jgi:uncharacterized SAM-binding protein YcdF (DUF218 family)